MSTDVNVEQLNYNGIGELYKEHFDSQCCITCRVLDVLHVPTKTHTYNNNINTHYIVQQMTDQI